MIFERNINVLSHAREAGPSTLTRGTRALSLGLTQQTIKPNLSITILLRQGGPGTPQYIQRNKNKKTGK